LADYVFKIKNCISVGSPAADRCVESAEFTVTIVDPCLSTSIISYAFPSTILEAPIASTNSLDVEVAMLLDNGAAQFPWPNTVNEIVNNAVYGNNVCGPIAFNVVQGSFNLVNLAGNTLSMAPLLDVHASGLYTFTLVGTLTDYNIVDSVQF